MASPCLGGSLTATVRNTVESGAQRTAERHGVKQVGNRNEFIESDALGCSVTHLSAELAEHFREPCGTSSRAR